MIWSKMGLQLIEAISAVDEEVDWNETCVVGKANEGGRVTMLSRHAVKIRDVPIIDVSPLLVGFCRLPGVHQVAVLGGTWYVEFQTLAHMVYGLAVLHNWQPAVDWAHIREGGIMKKHKVEVTWLMKSHL